MLKRALVYASVASMIDQFNMDNIKILQDLGYKVDVACNFEFGSTTSQIRVNELQKELEIMGVMCYHIPIPRKVSAFKDMIKAYKQTKKLIKENSYHIVHCHSPIGGVIARAACKKFREYGTKVIYTAHGFHFYKGAPKPNWLIFYPIEKYYARFTDILITINKEDYERANKFNAEKVVYVPGIGIHADQILNIQVDRENKRKELGIAKDDHMLLSVGELNDNKNHEVIIKALAKVEKPYKYVICGKGYKKDFLYNLAKKLGIEDKVIFAGYRPDIWQILKSADIFCFPSKREGLSVALMEAMAAGLPCIVSKIRGNIDLIIDGKGGFQIHSLNADAFSAAIERYFENSNDISKHGKFNLSQIKSFDASCVKQIITAIYGGNANEV